MMNVSEMRRERIQRLIGAGVVSLDEAPNDWQIEQCRLAMFPLITQREYQDYYGEFDTWLSRMPQRGLAQFFFGTYFFDPTGLTRTKEGLIWHVLSLNHLFAEGVVYDIQMLASFENGLEDLISEVKAVIHQTHPHTWLLRQMVGSPDYHPMILEVAQKGLRGEFTPSPPSTRVETMLADCLSFPKTPLETLMDGRAMKRLLQAPVQLLQNVLSALLDEPPPTRGKVLPYTFGPESLNKTKPVAAPS